MARIRTIKPEFFTSEDIVGLSPFARLLYIALWCEADKEGRMVWRPNTFKLRYLPGDDVDIQSLANELVQGGLVVLYGDGHAVIPRFRQHQHINPRESDSKLPEPDATLLGDAGNVTRRDASARVNDAQGGREGKGKEGDIGAYAPVAENPATAPPPASGVPRVPVDQVLEAYHELLPDLPRVRIMDDRRRKAIASFWRWVMTSKKTDGTPRAGSAEEAVEWTRAYFGRAAENDFLMGRGTRSAGHENWRCDLDFLLSDKGRRHVIEKTGGQA